MHLTYNPLSGDFIRQHNGTLTRHALSLEPTVENGLAALELLRSLIVAAPKGASRPSPMARPRDDLEAAIEAHIKNGGYITTSTYNPTAKRAAPKAKLQITLADLGLD